MSEFGLRSFVEALMDFTEVMDAHLHDSCGKNDFYLESCKPQMMNNVQAINLKIKSSLAVSRSSVAWFEMLLVEISLRNRDRFGTVWPLLSAHYSRILMGSLTFSYITERFLFIENLVIFLLLWFKACRWSSESMHPNDVKRSSVGGRLEPLGKDIINTIIEEFVDNCGNED
jgi:hypothetical protein